MDSSHFRLHARLRLARRFHRRLDLAHREAERDRMLEELARPDRR